MTFLIFNPIYVKITFNMSAKKLEREIKVIELYTIQKMECSQIANELKMQRRSVYRVLERNNIFLRENIRIYNCELCDNNIPVKFRKKERKYCGTCTTAIRRYKIKLKALTYLGGKCVECEYDENISCLDFHHINPNDKVHNLGANIITTKKWVEIERELNKCIILCANCHRKKHSNYNNPKFQIAILNTSESVTGAVLDRL